MRGRGRHRRLQHRDAYHFDGETRGEWYYLDGPDDAVFDRVRLDLQRYFLPRISEIDGPDTLVRQCLASGGEFERVSAALLLARLGDPGAESLFAQVMRECRTEAWKREYQAAAARFGII